MSVRGDQRTEGAVREEFREWLRPHLPFPAMPVDDDERRDLLSSWQATLYDGGWVGVSFPVEHGGRDLSPVFEAIVNEELGAAGAPSPFHYGYVARVLLERGSDEQRARFLRAALRGDERWCQGFSEPDAGSDLAAIRTSAERVGDDFVISGQKVWTSRAHWADWCFLLARTGAPDSRHRGLTCIIVPTDASGLTIRPFRQMTGGLEFAELFLDEVRVPASMVVGGVDGGWAVAMATVAYERGPADVGRIAELHRRLRLLVEFVRRGGVTITQRHRITLGALHVELQVLARHVLRGLREREAGRGDLTTTSIDKLFVTSIEQSLARVELDVHGAAALTGRAADVLFGYLEGRAASVYGGSSQIQRNILATRALGLPRS